MKPYGLKELPEGYQKIFSIDLQKDKKLMIIVNVIALIIMLVVFGAGLLIRPLSFRAEGEYSMVDYLLKLGVMLVGSLMYIVLHEVVHGIFMKAYSQLKPRYGFTGVYAYAGSDAYFNKRAYIIIALAPIVIWGIVFAVLCFLVPKDWFWVVYILQIINLSGAGGDIYVTWKFSKLPMDILVQDDGVSMNVYSAK